MIERFDKAKKEIPQFPKSLEGLDRKSRKAPELDIDFSGEQEPRSNREVIDESSFNPDDIEVSFSKKRREAGEGIDEDTLKEEDVIEKEPVKILTRDDFNYLRAVEHKEKIAKLEEEIQNLSTEEKKPRRLRRENPNWDRSKKYSQLPKYSSIAVTSRDKGNIKREQLKTLSPSKLKRLWRKIIRQFKGKPE